MLRGLEMEDLVLGLKNKNKSMDASQKKIFSSTSLDEMEMISPKPSPKVTSRRIHVLKRSASGKFIKYLLAKECFHWFT